MRDSVEPKRPWHLFLSQVGTSHVYHDLPMRLNEPVDGLALGRSRDNLQQAVNEIFAYCQTKQFEVAVRVEAFCKRACRCLEEV
jgi:hypothetical protein